MEVYQCMKLKMGKIMSKEKKEEFIYFLKFLACLLITNSHCGDFYPLSYMAIGGGFGNAIFFIVSGYCLVNVKGTFIVWYKKRLKRILPVTMIVILIDNIVNNKILGYNIQNTNILLYYVNKYWFVFAIMIYYVFYYILFYKKNNKKVIAALIVHFLIYLYLYMAIIDKTTFSVELEGFAWFKVYFYLSIIIVGGLLRCVIDENKSMLKGKKKIYISCLWILSVICWTVTYSIILLLKRGYFIQCMIQFSVFVFAITSLGLSWMYKNVFESINSRIQKVIGIVADSTLEIYLVQIFFSEMIKKNVYSGGWIGFWLAALGGGVIFHLLISSIGSYKMLLEKR